MGPGKKGTEVLQGAYSFGNMEMSSNADKPDVQDDTDQWDWVPVEPRRDRRRIVGVMMLAASCLTLGVLAGVLSASIVQRTTTAFQRTASDVPQTAESARKPSSEPSLALGGPSDTTTKPQEGAPTAPVVINKGSAKIPSEQPRARDAGQAEGNVKEVEGQSPKAQDVAPKGSADHEAKRPATPGEKKESATPAKPRTVERSLKDYRDLRNYALGK